MFSMYRSRLTVGSLLAALFGGLFWIDAPPAHSAPNSNPPPRPVVTVRGKSRGAS